MSAIGWRITRPALLFLAAVACWNPSDEELTARKMLDAQIAMPIPPSTDVVVHDHFSKFTVASATTSFTTTLSDQQIQAFYDRELPKRRWIRIASRPLEDMSFCRGDWLASLAFRPRGVAADYTLAFSSRPGGPCPPSGA